MLRRFTMGSIWRPSDDTDSRYSYPIVFIQYVNGLEPMANKLWSHGLDNLCHDVHPKVQVHIPPGTDGEFITEYLTTNERRIRIIGQSSVNGRMKFTGFPEGWDIILTYISNAAIPDTNIGWG